MRHAARPLFLPLLLLPLAGCSFLSGPDQLYAVPISTPGETIPIAFSSVEVRDVTLPTYANYEEIYVEGADGTLQAEDGLLWADDPARAASLELVRALSALTGVIVAGEPWPFDPYPAARVEVRVEEMIASRRGEFRLSGQYFVAALDGSQRDSAHLFAITTPLGEEAGAAEIAAARGSAVAELARQIARGGLS
ncbi:membrane integrity-associated transporter subunit PqiC [Pseudoroseicyclus sp. CXY001]|uniref:PqiC family protein n=1 Tax=Pseudoroseicyclus sp. CXY001 TaxID=3242492 RepID=UPI003571590E